MKLYTSNIQPQYHVIEYWYHPLFFITKVSCIHIFYVRLINNDWWEADGVIKCQNLSSPCICSGKAAPLIDYNSGGPRVIQASDHCSSSASPCTIFLSHFPPSDFWVSRHVSVMWVSALGRAGYKLWLLGVTQIILMSARSVTHGPAITTSQSEARTILGDQSEASNQSRDPGTAEMNLILTDINMICVTDMSHKYFTLYEPNMKTFLYLEPHEIWADPCISPKPLLF